VRLTVRYGGVYYAGDEYGDFYYGGEVVKFIGKLREIEVTPGSKGPRVVQCTAYDFLHEMSRNKVSLIEVKTSRRSDLAFGDLVSNMDAAPTATSYAAGQTTFTYAFDDIKDESTTILSAVNKVVLSEFGMAYLKGDGTLVFEDRFYRVGSTSAYTITDSDLMVVEVSRSVDNIWNSIQAVSFPREVSAAATDTLYQLQTYTEIAAGVTHTFTAQYRDPSGRSIRIGGTAMVTPLVANTHYKFGSVADGSTADKNADLTVSVTFGGNSALVTLTNTSGSTGYVNLLKLVGKAVRTYDPVVALKEDATSITAYDRRELKIAYPYLTSPLEGDSRATALLAAFKDPQTFIDKIGFTGKYGNRARMATNIEPGTRITLTETVTGITAQDYFVDHVSLSFLPNGRVRASYKLRQAIAGQWWLLGTTDYSELGDTTVLGGATV
jgi:hypothetical protein